MKLKYHMIYFVNKLLGRHFPCGRTKKDSYLCCCWPINKKTVFVTTEGTRAYCKYCGTIRMQSNHKIDIEKHIW